MSAKRLLVDALYWPAHALSLLPGGWWYPTYNRLMIWSSELDERWETGRWQEPEPISDVGADQ